MRKINYTIRKKTFNIGYFGLSTSIQPMLKLSMLKLSILTSVMKTDLEIHFTISIFTKIDFLL